MKIISKNHDVYVISLLSILSLSACNIAGNEDKSTDQQKQLVHDYSGAGLVAVNGSQSAYEKVAQTLAFSVTNSQAVVTMQNGVATSDGLSNQKPEKKTNARADQSDASLVNLVSLNGSGDASPAILSDGNLTIGYTVTDPEKKYLYVVLNTNSFYSGDYSPETEIFAAREQCAVYKVSLEDNSYSCALNKVLPLNSSSSYGWSKVRGGVKPVQFDKAGNVFIYGQKFTSECVGNHVADLLVNTTSETINVAAHSFTAAQWEQAVKDNNFKDPQYFYEIGATDDEFYIRTFYEDALLGWDSTGHYYAVEPGETIQKRDENGVPLFKKDPFGNNLCDDYHVNTHLAFDGQTIDSPFYVFRIDNLSGEVTRIGQEGESIDSFMTLGTGEVSFESTSTIDHHTRLKMWSNGSVTTINEDGVSSAGYLVDGYNTLLVDNFNLVRPRAAGGSYKASIDTSLFPDLNISGSCATTIVGDNGKLYAHHNSASCSLSGIEEIALYQVLPADPEPVAKLGKLGARGSYVSDGYLFRVETVANVVHGNIDVLKAYDLSAGSSVSLLDVSTSDIDNGASFYDIYTWVITGDKILFSGLDQKKNTPVFGEVDVAGFKQGKLESEVMTINEMTSVIGATNKVVDIEVTQAVQQDVDEGLPPRVSKFYSLPDNLYSVSIDFNKDMDQSSVEENLSFTDVQGIEIPYVPIWLNRSLHLIPDLNGFEDQEANQVPLATNGKYTLSVGETSLDTAGHSMSENSDTDNYPLSYTFETLTENSTL